MLCIKGAAIKINLRFYILSKGRCDRWRSSEAHFVVQWEIHVPAPWTQATLPGFRARCCQLLVGTYWESPMASLASVSLRVKSGLRYLPSMITLRRISEIIDVTHKSVQSESHFIIFPSGPHFLQSSFPLRASNFFFF